MRPLRSELDRFLLELAWSLWTELGVAGVKRNHKNFLITLEDLIILTVALIEVDPRLRDESLDWCSQYHHFISISRLKSLLKHFDRAIHESFSLYSATLNSISPAAWPVFDDIHPFHISLSHKSCLRPLDSPALLNIRARSLFGTGARADVVTFFLTQAKSDFSSADIAEIGYTKRNIVAILEEFCLSGVVEKFLVRNQWRYRLLRNEPLEAVLSPIPSYAPSWLLIFEILLPFRSCIVRTEKSAESTRVVEIRNLLITLEHSLVRLNLFPPTWENNFTTYLIAFEEWLIKMVRELAHGVIREDCGSRRGA